MKILFFCLMVLLSGCAHYSHEHVFPDMSKDKTVFNSFLMMGSANKIHTFTKQDGTNYARTVNLGSVQGQGDTEFVKAVAAGATEGAIKGAAAVAGKP